MPIPLNSKLVLSLVTPTQYTLLNIKLINPKNIIIKNSSNPLPKLPVFGLFTDIHKLASGYTINIGIICNIIKYGFLIVYSNLTLSNPIN